MLKINIELIELDIISENFKMVSTSNDITALHNIIWEKAELLLDKFYAVLRHQDNFTTKRKYFFLTGDSKPLVNPKSQGMKKTMLHGTNYPILISNMKLQLLHINRKHKLMN